MKKSSLLFLFLLQINFNFAQIIRGQLEGARFYKNEKGIVLLGFDRTEGNVFKAQVYDEGLNLLNEYSKIISTEINIFQSVIYSFGNYFEIDVSTEPKHLIIRLDPELKEIKEFPKDLINSYHRVALTLDKYSNRTLTSSDQYLRSVSGTTLCYGGQDWSFSVSNKKQKKKKLGQDNVYCVNDNSLEITFDVPVIFSDTTENVFVSNAYFDPSSKNLLVIGLLYKAGGSVIVDGLGLLVYDEKGILLKTQRLNLSTPVKRLPTGMKLKNITAFIKKIGKSSDGSYYVNAEIGINVDYPMNSYPQAEVIPVMYAHYELNKDYEINNQEFEEVENISSKTTIFHGTSSDGKIILLSNTNNGLKKIEYIDFTKPAGQRTIILDSFEFKTNINYNFNSNYDSDYFNECVAGKNHIITFHKYPSSNIYDLKSYLIK